MSSRCKWTKEVLKLAYTARRTDQIFEGKRGSGELERNRKNFELFLPWAKCLGQAVQIKVYKLSALRLREFQVSHLDSRRWFLIYKFVFRARRQMGHDSAADAREVHFG